MASMGTTQLGSNVGQTWSLLMAKRDSINWGLEVTRAHRDPEVNSSNPALGIRFFRGKEFNFDCKFDRNQLMEIAVPKEDSKLLTRSEIAQTDEKEEFQPIESGSQVVLGKIVIVHHKSCCCEKSVSVSVSIVH